MKERYNVEISDVQLSIVSDEPEEFVNSTVAKINERVSELIVRNKRCSKLDAALLCALDYCGEYTKAERRIRNLEAQISLYDANLKRMREELAGKTAAPDSVKSAVGVPVAAEEKAKDKQLDGDQLSVDISAESENKPAAASKPETKEESKKDESSKKSKLEQIEMLLRQSNE